LVGPGGAPPANFTIGPLSAERSKTGEPLVVARVHNTGRRTLAISGNLTLSKGPGGLRAGPIPVRLQSALAPGASESVIVGLDKRLPRGPWKADIRLTSGLIKRAAGATISFPVQAGAAVSVDPADSHYLILVVIFLLVLLVLAAIALLSRARRKGRRVLEV
jgi:hypothetical protein